MLRSHLQASEELTDLLLAIPQLVKSFENQSPQALTDLINWITEAEDKLLRHRMTQSAALSALKAQIMAAGITNTRGENTRKQSRKTALEAIDGLQAAMHSALEPHRQRLDQARDVTAQLLQILAQGKAAKLESVSQLEPFAQKLWDICCNHEQLRPMAAQLRALLPQSDIICLLVEQIEPAEFMA